MVADEIARGTLLSSLSLSREEPRRGVTTACDGCHLVPEHLPVGLVLRQEISMWMRASVPPMFEMQWDARDEKQLHLGCHTDAKSTNAIFSVADRRGFGFQIAGGTLAVCGD